MHERDISNVFHIIFAADKVLSFFLWKHYRPSSPHQTDREVVGTLHK